MPIPNSDFDPKKALVILLGAEEWPGCNAIAGDDFPLGEDNPFRKSVDGIEEYFTKNLKIESANLKNCFNSNENSNTIIEEIKDFIKDTKATDLFFYYVGHGVKLDTNFYLLLRNSEQDFDYTYFGVHSLISVLKKTAINLRCYIILDACFSGTVAKTLSSTTNIGLFHSSYDKEISRILEDKSMTLFSKALLDVLKGDCYQDYPSHLELLSFSDLKLLVNHTMKNIHGDEKVATAGFFCNSGVVDNLKIFRNPSYDGSSPPQPSPPPEDTREITWHIITGGKGGVGKTLLSLFLMTYYINNGKIPLVIDFNGVNSDLKRLVNDEVGFGNKNYLSIDTGDDTLIIAKGSQGVFGSLIGWMINPYKMYTPESFFKFLSKVRKGLLEQEHEIQDKFGYTKVDLNTIIIDTNYHFANIFSQEAYHYNKDTFKKNDHFLIWFIWVYRQIINSYQQYNKETDFFSKKFNCDVGLMKAIAQTIEAQLGKKHNPFIHVINPMSITEKSAIEEIFKVIHGLITQDQVVKELDDLLKLKASPSGLQFGPLVELMNRAQQNALEKQEQFSFSNMLKALNLLLTADGSIVQGSIRPNNLFPISIYHKKLRLFHSKLPDIKNLDVYKVFDELFDTFCDIHKLKN